MKKKTFREGFTLIELSLAIVFVGILSLAVVLMINNTITAYRRGLTLNSINTTGMDLVDDMRSAVQNSSADAVSGLCTSFYRNNGDEREECLADGAYNFVSITFKDDVVIGADTSEVQNLGEIPVYGAFCTGTYSYIWNSGYFDNSKVTGVVNERWVGGHKDGTGMAEFVYLDGWGNEQTVRNFRLLKIRDDKRSVCVSKVRYNPETEQNEDNYEYWYAASAEEEEQNIYSVQGAKDANIFDVSDGYGAITEEPVDLILSDHENDLVLYNLAVPRPAESTTQQNMFYSASFILGTIRGGINVLSKGQSCEPPTEYEKEEFNYCAINKFNFAVQAGGE